MKIALSGHFAVSVVNLLTLVSGLVRKKELRVKGISLTAMTGVNSQINKTLSRDTVN